MKKTPIILARSDSRHENRRNRSRWYGSSAEFRKHGNFQILFDWRKQGSRRLNRGPEAGSCWMDDFEFKIKRPSGHFFASMPIA